MKVEIGRLVGEAALREVCDAALQALSEEQLAAALLSAKREAGAAEEHHLRLELEFNRRLLVREAACDHEGWETEPFCPKCGHIERGPR